MHATAPDNAVDTKLELANAYLEMGDPDAAREMLREVLDEGTVGQRDDARQLLAEIDRNKN
jgi:pilus assembly protein FimV